MWLKEYGGVDEIVFYVFCAVTVLIVLIGLVSIFLPCCIPSIKGVSPGGTMDFYIILGGRLIALTVLIRGVNVAWTNMSVLSSLCQLYPAALLMGLSMFFGGLFVKAATIYSYRWYKKPSASYDEWKPNLAMWGMLTVIGIAAVIWCILFTPSVAEIVENRYVCMSEAEFEWKVATSAWHGFILLLAFIMMPLQCKASRKTPCRKEATALGWAITNSVLSVVAGICIHFLYDDTPTVMYAVIGGLTLWMVLFCDIALLVGKASMAKEHTKAEGEYEDERYDVIKDDGISGDTLESNHGNSTIQFVNKGFEGGDREPETFNY